MHLDLPVRNVNRTVGTMLGYELTKRWGGEGLPDDTIDVTLTGSAGQSFGAFLPKGITLRLVGDTNDYFGKGLSGGRLTLRPDPSAPFAAEENIIAGNVILYGATAGEIFVRGIVGERFCVRNSGALAVVEGVGDHGCEYMTGGRVVVLGRIGRNFAAGMSGGIAYVLDLPAAPGQPGDGRHRPAHRRRPRLPARRRRAALHRDRLGGGPRAAARLGRGGRPVRQDHAQGLQAGQPRPGDRRARGPRRRTKRSWRPPMGDPKGFLTTPRELPRRRPVELRLQDWREVYEDFDRDALEKQAGRCMNCGIPFCHQGCPLANLIPEWNDLVYRHDWREASERLHATNNFPEFTGTLCPAPCEAACVLAINSDAGDHQAGRDRDRRPGLGRGLGDPAAAGARHRQAGGRGRLRARPGWPRPSS